MIPLAKLRRAAKDGLAYLSAQDDVDQAEVFASANGNLTVRLNYTSHIPSNGVEEPKSVESHGLGLRVAFRSPQGLKIGFASEPTDLSLEGVKRALAKARNGAVYDPEFVSLPKPSSSTPSQREPDHSTVSQREPDHPLVSQREPDHPPLSQRGVRGDLAPAQNQPGRISPPPGTNFHDPSIMRLGNNRLVEAGWRMMERGLDVFQSSEDLLTLVDQPQEMLDLGLILGGDAVFLQERMAIASTFMPRVQSDQSTMVMSFATAMVESRAAKGSGWSVDTHLAGFDGGAAAEAARNAVSAIDGVRLPSGKYRVVLGPQPLTEILEWVLLPGLHLDMFYAGASPFMGKLGQRIASEQLSIYDHGAQPGLAGSKRITDEGLPTGRTDLIREGVLAGLMSDYYNYQRILNDPQGRQKLGVDPNSVASSIAPRNGFRPGNGGGRDFDSSPSITPTNLLIQGQPAHNQEELLRLVGDGIYIGRIWYTYPVNGITAGDFSGTIVGDSYVIKDGKLAAPLKANTLRMNDNVLRVIDSILGIGSQQRPTVRWSSDQVTWAPEVALADFQLEEIGGYIEDVF